MPPLHLDRKTVCGHFGNDRFSRPEIDEIADLRLREIGVIQPVVALLRTHVVEREPAAAPQHAKGLAQHARLVAEMVEGVLTTDEAEAARGKTATPHCRRAPRRCPAFCAAWRNIPSEPSRP